MKSKIEVSLAMISGDVGLEVIRRALESVLIRPGGPLVDEVVIGFNGTKLSELEHIVDELHSDVSIIIEPHAWTGNFATARNEVMAACRGEWVMHLDTDEVVTVPDRPDDLRAINAVEKDYGLTPSKPMNGAPPAPRGFAVWLRSLPFEVNVVQCPLDYEVNVNGEAVTRQVTRRVLRRSANWIWQTPDGVHEIPYPFGSVGEGSVVNPAFLIRHFPNEEVLARVRRNQALVREAVTTLTAESGTFNDYSNDRLHWDVATTLIQSGQLDQADVALQEAIRRAPYEEDRFRYTLARVGLFINRGKVNEALPIALGAIGISPDRPEGYFAAVECFHFLGQWRSVIAYFEMGRTKVVVPASIDAPINRYCAPRAYAAHAHIILDEPDKGLNLALEALERYPAHEMSQRAASEARDAMARKRAITGLLDAVEYMTALGDTTAKALLRRANTFSLRGIESILRYRALEPKVKQLGETKKVKVGETSDGRGIFDYQPTDLQECSEMRAWEYLEQTGRYSVRGIEARYSEGPYRRRVHFFCPHAAYGWDPMSPELEGCGGSETAVVMVARELYKLGYAPIVYCPTTRPWPQVREGVMWRDVKSFNDAMKEMDPVTDIIIACRAPWLIRAQNRPRDVPIYAWHQDNGYGNDWQWSSEVDSKLAGNFHVSEWAKRELLKELKSGPFSPHHVIYNAPLDSAYNWDPNTPRDINKFIYASDPSRGLEQLLDDWPKVREEFPNAVLHVYGDFAVLLALGKGHMGSPHAVTMARVKLKLESAVGVVVHGKVPQGVLSAEMHSANAMLYPGGPMPEGYGVSLVSAVAAGCLLYSVQQGALVEVLGSAAAKFESTLDAVRDAYEYVGWDEVNNNWTPNYGSKAVRRAFSERLQKQQTWKLTAKRMHEVLERFYNDNLHIQDSESAESDRDDRVPMHRVEPSTR